MAGSFYRLECADCENRQVVFAKASTAVNCAVCGSTLSTPTGGTAEFHGDVLEVVEDRAEDTTA